MMDKLSKALTPGVLKALDKQPESVRARLRDALNEIVEKLDGNI